MGIKIDDDPEPTPRHPYQIPPDTDWDTFAIIAGRGAGKTFAGAEWIIGQIDDGAKRVALVAPTSADARDVMVEGPSGILRRAEARGWPRPSYEPSKRRISFDNGAVAFTYSAEEPDRLRGPSHDAAWCDELGAWKYAVDTWDNLQFGLRDGQHPQAMVTTTPRPVHLVRQLIKQAAEGSGRVVISRGSTHDNAANLAPSFLDTIQARYGGTRLGRQEIEGELLEDVEGALWTLANIDKHRRAIVPEGVSLARVVVAVDPAATSNEESNETGIIVAAAGSDRRGYVLADVTVRAAPLEWASRAVSAFDSWEADTVVVETNQGGEMVTQTLRTVRPGLPVKEVHASRGKSTRAEPISALYEQGVISHVGSFPALEDQLTNWVPGMTSPDRLDALVWAMTALYPHIGGQRMGGLI